MTLSKIIEQLKAADQNKSGMFELGEDVMCALVDMLERREGDAQEITGWRALQNDNRDLREPLYLDGFNEPVGWNSDYEPVYSRSAPPAPVVQSVPVQDERSNYEAFVEQRLGDCVDRRRAKNGDQEYMAWDMAMGWIVWQGHAAMLNGGQA